MRFTVIVPAYNAEKTLPRLTAALSRQIFRDFETIIVDDASTDGTAQVSLPSPAFRWIRSSRNRGPAHCRNVGARRARGEVLVFTDSDCLPDRFWLENLHHHFSREDPHIIMGRLVLLPSTFLGDAISALGFPAGGAIGFDKMWRVDAQGYTDSLSSCNVAFRRAVFRKTGGFDESFPYAGGEDSLLARRACEMGFRIRYCPDVVVYHGARDSLRGFWRWQFRRGISSFIFSTKVTRKKDFVSLRVWSTGNVIRYSFKDRKFPLVLVLLGLSIIAQGAGFFFGKHLWKSGRLKKGAG